MYGEGYYKAVINMELFKPSKNSVPVKNENVNTMSECDICVSHSLVKFGRGLTSCVFSQLLDRTTFLNFFSIFTLSGTFYCNYLSSTVFHCYCIQLPP